MYVRITFTEQHRKIEKLTSALESDRASQHPAYFNVEQYRNSSNVISAHYRDSQTRHISLSSSFSYEYNDLSPHNNNNTTCNEVMETSWKLQEVSFPQEITH